MPSDLTLPHLSSLDHPSVPPRAFAEPWQAQVFAMTLELHRTGVFTWPEWAAALSEGLAAPGAAGDGSDYYLIWLAALEGMLERRGVADAQTLRGLTAAWHRAAAATPHGAPILLANDPDASADRDADRDLDI